MIRVAVTSDGHGNVFQHFGQTQEFRVFNINDGKVVDSETIQSGPYSHGSLATLLKENGVNVLICGGIGEGAIRMLGNKGIKAYPGMSGNIDAITMDFVEGRLKTTNIPNCDHDHDCHCMK